MFGAMESKFSSIMNHKSHVIKPIEEEKDPKEEEYVWNNNGGTGDELSFSKNDNFIYIS